MLMDGLLAEKWTGTSLIAELAAAKLVGTFERKFRSLSI